MSKLHLSGFGQLLHGMAEVYRPRLAMDVMLQGTADRLEICMKHSCVCHSQLCPARLDWNSLLQALSWRLGLSRLSGKHVKVMKHEKKYPA